MSRQFQFSLVRIFVAMTLVAISMGLTQIPNPYPDLMQFWFPFSCALVGAAIGVLCGPIKRFALYDFAGAVALGVYAWIT